MNYKCATCGLPGFLISDGERYGVTCKTRYTAIQGMTLCDCLWTSAPSPEEAWALWNEGQNPDSRQGKQLRAQFKTQRMAAADILAANPYQREEAMATNPKDPNDDGAKTVGAVTNPKPGSHEDGPDNEPKKGEKVEQAPPPARGAPEVQPKDQSKK